MSEPGQLFDYFCPRCSVRGTIWMTPEITEIVDNPPVHARWQDITIAFRCNNCKTTWQEAFHFPPQKEDQR